jgi:hypothetical protein
MIPLPARPTIPSTRRLPIQLGRIASCLTMAMLIARPAIAQRAPTGHFYIERSGRGGDLQLTLSDRGDDFNHGNSTFSIEPNALKGLAPAQLEDAYAGPVHFTLTRDAGTITFDGKASSGEASGQYSFSANQSFKASLASRGHGSPSESEQFQLALYDVGYPMLDELKSQRYPTATIAELVRMGMHGVDIDYVHDMGALRYRFASVSELTRFRDHGVDPEFVSELQRGGYSDLDSQELLKLKDHGVDGDFIGDLARVGFTRLSTAELLRARDHGVTASFIDGIKRAGYSGFSINDFVRLRDHGVSASFAKRMKARSSSTPTVQDLVYAMDHGDDDGE